MIGIPEITHFLQEKFHTFTKWHEIKTPRFQYRLGRSHLKMNK
jgi:hypothetical protein